jgi:hypothetical protein
MLIKSQRAKVYFNADTYTSGFGNSSNFNLGVATGVTTTGIAIIKGAFYSLSTGVAALVAVSLF